MDPTIQYAKTEDGVSIAYWTIGEGTPLLATPNGLLSWSLRSWQDPESRAFHEKVAQGRLVVHYDHRGTGNSEHDISEQSIETLVADIESVADQAGLDQFALFGSYVCGPYAIAYAARHPERVSKLILMLTSARSADFFNRLDRLQKARESADEDPEFYLQIFAHEVFGWVEAARAESWVSELLKEINPNALEMNMATVMEADVTELLQQVAVPTLVLHGREMQHPNLDAARTLAGGIPGAQLVVLEGDLWALYRSDADSVVSAMNDFLADGEEASTRTVPPAPGDTHTILFTDMESSTALTQSLGDEKAQELVRAHNAIVREALGAHDGTEIKHTGDGIMASFGSAVAAVAAAVEIQHELTASEIRARVGLNAGEPIAVEEDLFGTAVQLAARITDAAEPGQVLVSNVVRELCAGKTFTFEPIGEARLKGIKEPVALYQARGR
jgi:class 3 adenylate cyclase